jgi:hypothetical protein
MQFSKWPAVVAAFVVIAACFFPWVTIESKQAYIGGFHSSVTDYGKPGVLHAFLCGLCIIFLLVARVWSVRAAFFISALNIAWAMRNFFLISACQAGICPVKQPALYVVVVASILLTLLTLAVRVPMSAEATD